MPLTARQTAANLTLACTALLIAFLVYLNVTSPAFNPLVLAALLLPIALTLPGLVRGSPRSYQWLCFLDLFFLTQGILLCFTPGRLVPGIFETLVCLILFFSAIIFIRARQRNG